MYKGTLSQEQAAKRFALFADSKDNIHYDVFLKLQKGPSYSGRVIVSFELQGTDGLFFDTTAKSIEKINVNSQVLEMKDNSYQHLRNDRHLSIPAESLVKGKNVIIFEFTSDYVNDGNGLHSFVDTDDKQYLYSTCEPYHCNKMLPCFDQPDLKATWKLTTAAPNDWIVVSNARADSNANPDQHKLLTGSDVDNTMSIKTFQSTLRISSYLFCVCAGPYVEIKSETTYRDVEMSCFCRESLAKFLKDQSKEIFEITQVCMEFYEGYFGYKYPFGKYDQVFCPEYNMGAMENPGCVTFNDSFIFKDKTTVQKRTYVAVVVTHELAHMWFGDLVTMKWWNDLWLNESFAEFISHFAMFKIQDKLKTIKFSDVWLEFNATKGWGYREDQLETTHPIYGEVKDTADAESIFDGITYAKGSAVLKQLMALIGEENFSNAMKTYFNKYQFTNTILQNFMDCMQENYKPLNPAYPDSLDEWQKQWIRTAGLNEITPSWDPTKKSDKETITLTQRPTLPQHATLRVHKMKIVFYGENCEIIEIRNIVIPNQETSTIEYDGTKKIQAILLNYDDEAFIKVRIDHHSKEFFKSNLRNVKEELTRSLIWRSFWDMLRDGLLSSVDFIDISGNAIFDEAGDSNLNEILRYSSSAISNFTPLKIRPLLSFKMFELVHQLLKKTDPKNNNRIVLLREKLISFAKDQSHLDLIVDWFVGRADDFKDYPMGIPDKWAAVKKIYQNKKISLDSKKEFYHQVKLEDPSDESEKIWKVVEALSLTKEQRADVWKSYLKQGKDSVHLAQDSMSGFNSNYAIEDLKEYHEEFFKVLLDVFRSESREYSGAFLASLYPNGDDLDHYIDKTNEIIKQVDPEKEAWFLRELREIIDDLKRKTKAYDCFYKSISHKPN